MGSSPAPDPLSTLLIEQIGQVSHLLRDLRRQDPGQLDRLSGRVQVPGTASGRSLEQLGADLERLVLESQLSQAVRVPVSILITLPDSTSARWSVTVLRGDRSTCIREGLSPEEIREDPLHYLCALDALAGVRHSKAGEALHEIGLQRDESEMALHEAIYMMNRFAKFALSYARCTGGQGWFHVSPFSS